MDGELFGALRSASWGRLAQRVAADIEEQSVFLAGAVAMAAGGGAITAASAEAVRTASTRASRAAAGRLAAALARGAEGLAGDAVEAVGRIAGGCPHEPPGFSPHLFKKVAVAIVFEMSSAVESSLPYALSTGSDAGLLVSRLRASAQRAASVAEGVMSQYHTQTWSAAEDLLAQSVQHPSAADVSAG